MLILTKGPLQRRELHRRAPVHDLVYVSMHVHTHDLLLVRVRVTRRSLHCMHCIGGVATSRPANCVTCRLHKYGASLLLTHPPRSTSVGVPSAHAASVTPQCETRNCGVQVTLKWGALSARPTTLSCYTSAAVTHRSSRTLTRDIASLEKQLTSPWATALTALQGFSPCPTTRARATILSSLQRAVTSVRPTLVGCPIAQHNSHQSHILLHAVSVTLNVLINSTMSVLVICLTIAVLLGPKFLSKGMPLWPLRACHLTSHAPHVH
jgi:hypothetical protein